MSVPIGNNVILGVTHLLVGGQLVPLLKCPFCNFKNIYEDEIKHHIRYKDDTRHKVDADKIDRKTYFVTMKKSNKQHIRKEHLPDSIWPWIKCLWCDYRDKLPRDLEWHFIEEHKDRLYRIKIESNERASDAEWTQNPYLWMYSNLEYILSKLAELAKIKSGTGEQN
jgi:hypothetical protein